MEILQTMFRKHGQNFKFDPFSIFSYQNITVGDDLYIGLGAKLLSSESRIDIGSKVMFGPNILIITGD